MKWMSFLWFGFGFFLLGLSFIGGRFIYASAFVPFALFMAYFSRSAELRDKWFGKLGRRENATSSSPVIPQSQPIAVEKLQTIQNFKEKRKVDLQNLEELIDNTLLQGINLLSRSIPSVHTIAVFLPARVDGMYLRVWVTGSDALIPGAKIQEGQGLVGRLLKEGVTRLYEEDISTSSINLQYYSTDEKIRSLAGVPIVVKGARRGVVVVDSLQQKAWKADVLDALKEFAEMVGQFMFHAYLSIENSYQRDQLAALSNYQRKFFENMSEREIVTYIQQYMEQTLESDRILLIARSREEHGKAIVVAAQGIDASYFENFEFDLSEKGLVSLVFEKDQVMSRSFKPGESTFRLSSRERKSDEFRSFLAVPVRTERGVSHALVVESVRRPWFSNHQKELLLTISRAAGFALARARLYHEKEQMSRCDGLTGLLNHRTFQEMFKKEILRATRENAVLTILMIDIDYFKKVNDTYGHPVGDVVLKETAKMIGNSVRAGNDIVARYGGEEFVCLLAGSSLETSRETAERIRETIKTKEFDVGNGQKLKVSASIGGAMYPKDSTQSKDVLDKADKALYHAKKTGRDKVIFYTDE